MLKSRTPPLGFGISTRRTDLIFNQLVRAHRVRKRTLDLTAGPTGSCTAGFSRWRGSATRSSPSLPGSMPRRAPWA